jgi:hypothetical protein
LWLPFLIVFDISLCVVYFWDFFICRQFTPEKFVERLRKEQMDLLNRMDIPPGVAKNQALLENVFVTLVCILNRIPLFVVGKPGSGKTLSLQLIYRFALPC